MLLKIKEFLIIVNKKDIKAFKSLLGNGNQLGINISYKIQNKPSGIPEALIIGKEFINNDNFALILGDNIFYGQGLIEILKKEMNYQIGAKIFCYPVNDPKDFGVLVTNGGEVVKIIEKPKEFISNLAITGLYFFDKKSVNVAKNLIPSKRNETEIVDILNFYLKNKLLKYSILGRGCSWLDTGNIKNNLSSSNFVQIIEERQNYKIGCIEEIALKNKWIKKKDILKIAKILGDNEYSEYLKNLN